MLTLPNPLRPRATAILAWCQEHPYEVGDNQELVDQLRIALAIKRPYGSIILSIYGEIPETCDIEPAKAGG